MTATSTSEFNMRVAPGVAATLGLTKLFTRGKLSRHFAYFYDDERLLVVAGEATGANAGLALAYGLTWRAERRLELALPANHSFATTQRAAWLHEAARPLIHLHDGLGLVAENVPISRQEAEAALRARIPLRNDPTTDLSLASEPLHLGDCGGLLPDLTEWATQHRDLDPAHRQSYRAWHHMGQSVLEIKGTCKRATIRAGINAKAGQVAAITVTSDRPLSTDALARCKQLVEQGIAARKDGPYHRADEHWLQAVLRADPRLAGVEPPALREVPGWRPPSDPEAGLNRGYVDLVGLDGNGDIRVVETKLAANDDAMLILQGLDYYTWATVYAAALRSRLGVSKRARIRLCYLIGSSSDAKIKVSRYAQAQADAIEPEVQPHYLGVTDWFAATGPTDGPEVKKLDPAALPV